MAKEYIPLISICDFQGGSQPPKDEWIDHAEEGYVRMLQIRDFTQQDKNKIEYVKKTKNLKICQSDDILIGRYGASVGKILTGLSGAYNVAIMKTIPDCSRIDRRYLYYYFTSAYFQKFILSVGVRAAQAGFNKSDLGKALLPCPGMIEQEKIVRRLTCIDTLISNQKKQIADLDLLIKSQFIEMFGDPDPNSKSWSSDTLGNHLDVIGGYAFKSTGFKENGIPVLKIGNINSGTFTANNLAFWEDDPELKRYKIYPEDLVMSLTGTVGKDDYGNVCIIGADYPEYYLNQRNAKLIPHTSLDSVYLAEMLKFPQIKKRLTGISRGVRQANISNKDILGLPVYIPSIEEQKGFRDIVQQADKSKFEIQQSIDKLEILKKSLMQEYFG